LPALQDGCRFGSRVPAGRVPAGRFRSAVRHGCRPAAVVLAVDGRGGGLPGAGSRSTGCAGDLAQLPPWQPVGKRGFQLRRRVRHGVAGWVVPLPRAERACPGGRRTVPAHRRGTRCPADPHHRLAVQLLGLQPGATRHPGGGRAPRRGVAPPAEADRLMAPIFTAQLRNLARNPWALLIMVALTVGMSLIFGFQATSVISVGVLPDASLTEAETTAWLDLLNESETFDFRIEDEDRVLAYLASNTAGLAVRLYADDWRVVAAQAEANADLLAGYVGRVYRQELTLRLAAERSGRQSVEALRSQLSDRLAEPVLTI